MWSMRRKNKQSKIEIREEARCKQIESGKMNGVILRRQLGNQTKTKRKLHCTRLCVYLSDCELVSILKRK